MENFRNRKTLTTILPLFLLALLMLSLSVGVVRGAGATVFTQTFHDATQSFPAANPCSGAPGTVTVTFNGVFHTTQLASGEFWATSTNTGHFTLTPTDPSQPTFTGHFEAWFGVSSNENNFVTHDILNIHGTGSDGSALTFHDTMHFSVSASGVVISFDKPSCG